MAEIISSSVPLPQYVTLSYNCLMKKPFTSNGALQYVQDRSNISSQSKEKRYKQIFPFNYVQRTKKEVLENDWAPQSHCVNLHAEKKTASKYWLQDKLTLTPSLSYQVHAKKDRSQRLSIHSEAATGHFLKANHIWWIGFINFSLPTHHLLSLKKTHIGKKDGLFWSTKSGMLGVGTPLSARTSDL